MMSSPNETSPLISVLSPGNSQKMESSGEYIVYSRRWYILAVLCILNISNAMIWICFSPIANITHEYYNVDDMSVNWLSLIYLVVCIPLGLVASWMLDTFGLRFGIILGAWLNAIGAIIRVVSTLDIGSNIKFPLVLTGQSIAASAQPLLLFAPTKMAALWFSDGQRATANMIASMSNPLGILIANVVSPAIVYDVSKFQLMIIIFAIPAGVGVIMATAGIWSSVPPTPPTSSAANVSEPFFEGLKKLAKNKAYWVLAISFGSGLGLFTSLTTLLEQILCPRGYGNSFSGLCGALLIAFGILGAAIAGIIVDKTKKFEEVAKLLYGFAAISGVFFALIAREINQAVLIAVATSLFGMFGFALYPICLELSVECSYPVGEAVSAGGLIISGQIQGIIFIIVMQVLAQDLSPFQRQFQNCENGSAPIEKQDIKDFTIPLLAFCAVAAAASTFLIFGFKTEYKRLLAEQQLAAERILHYDSGIYNPAAANQSLESQPSSDAQTDKMAADS
ncbi:unnamed protein product [Owenia fusiformis]|uniref:Major facilitator superfamily (MFS) profile domain-containing protein n=1 Tax=Owenia fusiformis TaxID=6347 RepID=A0A8S4NR27_OWEFU|nr:unnamed protein product [Owenia fusiformis]